jgi:cytochrome c556
MRILALMLAIGLASCANRPDTTQTSGNTGTTAGATTGTAGTANTSGAQAAARMTEQDYEKLMKQVGPTYQSLRKNLQDNKIADAAKEAQQLAELFGNVEKFWAQNNREDAVKWAAQARTYAAEAAGAATAGDAAKANAAAGNMGGACKSCHGTYRESDGAGGYRIKPGVIKAP